MRATQLIAPVVRREPVPWPFVVLFDDVLDAAECRALVALVDELGPEIAPITTPRGFEMRPDIRNNERVMFDNAPLAAELFGRMRPELPPVMEDGTLVGLNERFRGYRYQPGHRFAPHYDGSFVRDESERSHLTVLFYLNGDFTGGQTTFEDLSVTVTPRPGQALVFEHPLLHEGCPVLAGRKYVLRSDVMYRR